MTDTRDERSHEERTEKAAATGAGALGGGALGAAAGAAAGPAGALVGGLLGAMAGGAAGYAAERSLDPAAEDHYWRRHHGDRDYVDERYAYDDYGPAYRYGWEARQVLSGHDGQWSPELERDLGEHWGRVRGESRLDWERARHATRDAWQRAGHRLAELERESAGAPGSAAARPGKGVH